MRKSVLERGIIDASRIKGDLDLGIENRRGGATARIISPGGRLLKFQDILASSSVQNYRLGTKCEVDGCIFRYVLAGGVTLAAGKLVQSPVPDATHIDLVPTAIYGIGTTVITLTLGANPVTANQYAEGYLWVSSSTGAGQRLRIKSHPAANALATVAITCWDALAVATDLTSTFSLIQNKYKSAIVVPATGTYQNPQTAKPLGVPLCPITNGYYGWIVSHGPAPCLTTGTLYIGNLVEADPANAGALVACNYRFRTGSGAPADATHVAFVQDSTETPASPSAAAFAGDGLAASTTYDLGRIPVPLGVVLRVEAAPKYSLVDLSIE